MTFLLWTVGAAYVIGGVLDATAFMTNVFFPE